MTKLARSSALVVLLAVNLAACTQATNPAGDDAGPGDSGARDDRHVDPGSDGGPPGDALPRDGAPRDTAPPSDAAPDGRQADAAPLACASGAYSCDLDGGSGYCCGALCVDIYSDHDHCGDCTNACAAAEVCLDGYCVATSCAAPTATFTACLAAPGEAGTCCDGTCRARSYYATSETDCNACGTRCAVGATCEASTYGYGQCTRAGSYDWCGYDGVTCPTGSTCVTGQGACLSDSCDDRADMYLCALGGTAGRCCAETCTTIEYDPANCGSCGKVCPSGTWCSYGTCVAQQACDPLVSGEACEISATHAGVCCGGTCVDPTTDSSNCNQCGNACPLGSTCEARSCKQPDGETASCDDSGCPDGTFCNYYACWSPVCAPGSSGQLCAFGPTRTGTCCDGVCVDVLQDAANCGQCNRDCGGQWCVGGACFSDAPATSSRHACSYYSGCPAGERCDYTGHCVNCSDWAMDDFCYSPLECFEGRCLAPTCANTMPGTEPCYDQATSAIGICCGGFFNPHCVDILTDSDNCGECDRRCPAGSSCVGGDCTVTPADCRGGRHAAYCAPDAGTSSVCCAEGCIDLDSSATNCGGCGYACGAGLSCVDRACIALACTAALEGRTCARDGGTGTCCDSVCVDRATDPTNCGACGRYCSASMTCKGGTCGLDTCDAGHLGSTCHVTDTTPGLCCPDGCVDVKTDSQNCGGCEQPCPGTTTCQNGACHD